MSKLNLNGYKSFVPVTWWMHIGFLPKNNVLVCGDFDALSTKLLSAMSEQLFLHDSGLTSDQGLNNVSIIDRSATTNYIYDAIIINQKSLKRPISNSELSQLANTCLSDKGIICIYERSMNLKSYLVNPFLLLSRIFRKSRRQELFNLTQSKYITQYQARSYTPRPYESFLYGRYHNNKNTFLLSEKIKLFILQSFLSKFITNSAIWTICKSANSNSMIAELLSHLSTLDIPWVGNKIEILKVLYRPGKVIISLTSRGNNNPEYIAVIAIDDSSESQRNDEEAAINYLKKNSKISPYLTAHYSSSTLGFFKLYVMSEIIGVTVDVSNKSLQKMTSNAFKVILLYTKEFIRRGPENNLKQLANSYIDIFNERYPDWGNEFEQISNVLSAVNYDELPVVYMHGDAKLENFILDKNNEVIGIIDFELSEINGFPLFDLFYLITYNHHVENNRRFDLAYEKLLDNKIRPYEQDMISNYCKLNSISPYQMNILKVIFFIHHYTKRYRVLSDSDMKSKMILKNNLIKVSQFAKDLHAPVTNK